MAVPDRARVAELVGRLAAGDAAALVPFIDECGRALAGTVRFHLRDLHRPDVAGDPVAVDELVVEAALVIFDRAPAWSPAGAPPWVWATRAIRQKVVEHLGHPSVELDTDHPTWGRTPPPTAGTDHGDHAAEMDRLADVYPEVGLLREAIATVGSARDQAVYIEYQVHKRLGDPAPAHTVGAQFGLTPDNVRQIDHRMRRKMARLIERERRFAPLARLRWLAA